MEKPTSALQTRAREVQGSAITREGPSRKMVAPLSREPDGLILSLRLSVGLLVFTHKR